MMPFDQTQRNNTMWLSDQKAFCYDLLQMITSPILSFSSCITVKKFRLLYIAYRAYERKSLISKTRSYAFANIGTSAIDIHADNKKMKNHFNKSVFNLIN